MSGVLEADVRELLGAPVASSARTASVTRVMGGGQTVTLSLPRGTVVRVRRGEIWLTQTKDERDHVLKSSHVLSLNGRGATVISAFSPTVLELYRENPLTLRARVERCASVARSRALRRFLVRLFS